MRGAKSFGACDRSSTCHAGRPARLSYRPKQRSRVVIWLTCVLAVGGLCLAPGGQAAAGAAVMLTDGSARGGTLGRNTQISPDGARVVFTADTPAGDVAALYSVPITGGPVTQLHGGTVIPDNYQQLGGSALWWASHSVFEITPDGQSVIHIAEPSVGAVDLYKVPISGGPSVYLASLSGDDVDRLTFDVAADSAHIVYHLGAGYEKAEGPFNTTIYSVSTSGGLPPVTLFDVPPGNVMGGCEIAPISPDGSLVAFADANSLYVKDIVGGPAIKLASAESNLEIECLRFTADGSRINYTATSAFAAMSHVTTLTYSISANGGEPVLLSSSSGNVPYVPVKGIRPGGVATTTDGMHMIAAKSASPGVTEFYRFAFDTGDSTLMGTVTTGTERDFDKCGVLHDVSGAVYRGKDDDDAMSLWFIPFADGTPVRLTDDIPKLHSGSTVLIPLIPWPWWIECLITPDDQTVVYGVPTDDGIELFSVPITGGPSVRLDHGLAAELHVRDYRLTPDGGYVIYVAAGSALISDEENNPSGIYAVSVHGGPAWMLNDPLAADQYIGSYEIAPDGTVVYWAGNQDAGYDLYAAPIPEPATLGLLALAGAAMLGRRRGRYGIRPGS